MNNEIKNTLFRFVSMRAPELTDEKKQEEKFIFRNRNVARGVFDSVEDKSSKWEELAIVASNFLPLKVKEIKELNVDLTEFSIWIAKNRQSFTKGDLHENITKVREIDYLEILALLWNNLFYQTVTQQDFYAKETIIQLLIAIHVVSNYNSENFELSKKLLNAKVVLPKELFVENTIQIQVAIKTRTKQTIRTSKTPSSSVQKLLIIEEIALKNEKFSKLSKELIVVKKVYQKEYNAAFTIANDDYQGLIKPILDQHTLDAEAEKLKWCGVRDPQVTYNPSDPCNQLPTIPEPTLPAFEFEFRDELDIKYLSEKLSKESLETLSELTNNFQSEVTANKTLIDISTLPDDFESLEEIQDTINNTVNNNIQVITNNTEINQNVLVSIGGVLTPITSSVNYFDYEFGTMPFLGGKYRSYLSFEVPNASWQIESFDYTVEKNPESYSNNASPTTYSVKRIGNKITLMSIYIGLPTLAEMANYIAFEGEITFTNGVKKTFAIRPFTFGNTIYGSLSNIEFEDNGSYGQTGNNSQAPTFIPSGFGVKQLGIADYNKVEQTTLGYIEGDVAHIENIMAREFKEKSTRRLRRSENTFTSSSETEREQQTDTSTTNRFEMQSEVAKIIASSKDFQANAGFRYEPKSLPIKLSADVGYATHNSKEESTRQAMTQAQEITESALDRVVSKIKEERIEKIIEEFEENNTHGFDNRKGDKHVVGVFRWVDKVYKNQIYNYGKRLMFEFMIPQPAKLHILGMSEIEQTSNFAIVEPIDPRNSISNNLSDYSKINDTTIKFWASKYNVEIQPCSKQNISVSKGFNGNYNSTGYFTTGNDEITIPEGYEVNSAYASVAFDFHPNGMEGSGVSINIGDKYYNKQWFTHFNQQSIPFTGLGGIQQKLAVAYKAFDCGTFSMTVVAKCDLTIEIKQKWQQDTFKAIIDAYDDALTAYNEKLAAEKATGIQIKGTNPGFYREFENKILRKNCISYIIDQNPTAKNTYGKNNMFKTVGSSTIQNFGNTEVNVNQELDSYAAFVKFMEQAFEWDIMSYNLYPYYWGNRADWASLYQYDDTNDPLFRNFMQAGMARVIVTVRPGFEEAVRYYMQTGQIWNGGEVPVIEDELYLSIVDELSEIKGEKQGKAWPSRVPTALTILQAQSIGLKVTKALPFDIDDVNEDTFEDPSSVPQSSEIELSEAELGGSQTPAKTARLFGKINGNNGIESKILLKRIDGFIQDMTYCDIDGKWELNNLSIGKYELLLDANDDFSSDSYQITEGSKEQVVELQNDQATEINITLELI